MSAPGILVKLESPFELAFSSVGEHEGKGPVPLGAVYSSTHGWESGRVSDLPNGIFFRKRADQSGIIVFPEMLLDEGSL